MNKNMSLIAEFTLRYPGVEEEIESILFPSKNSPDPFLKLPFIHQIGQPAKTHMLCLFIGYALNKSDAELKDLEQTAVQSLEKTILNKDSILIMRWNAANILGQIQTWKEQFDNAIATLDIYKEAQSAAVESTEPTKNTNWTTKPTSRYKNHEISHPANPPHQPVPLFALANE